MYEKDINSCQDFTILPYNTFIFENDLPLVRRME